MKMLRYNDVKMFFIPFVGAAVSGKSRNDTAVKTCIVSLMGPLPGIVVGVLLYFLFFLTKNYYVLKTAQVMLLLNALNFLPIMPLDGGRYIDALFIDRRYLRFLFTLMGAAVFLTLAVLAGGVVLGLLGLLTIYIAFANFKVHGIANDLKSQGVKAASVDDLFEDESAMQIVISKLQTRYPMLFSPQISYQGIANQLTAIVDTLKFVPAKLLPKIVLLVLYLVLVPTSLLAALVFLAVNYREISRTEKIDGKETVYVERHTFTEKNSECPINDLNYYHGKGTAFGPDGRITDTFYYANGYRTGEWLEVGPTGEVIRKKTYDGGRLLSVSKLEDGKWTTYAFEELPFLQRLAEHIQRLSQPFKSNHEYFQEGKRG
jgi:hypothetical protein